MTQNIIVQIPLQDLHDSPFQPRTTYTGLEGLAAAITAEGCVHQALLVRPRIGPLFGNDPEAAAGYEIVFGHRRRRAAELAGLATAPCIVRSMSDAQVRSAQMVENVQRENMSALDEGAGFKAQIDAGDATADQIAERIGMSRSHVYGRIKLLQLCGPLRAALTSGEVGTEVALLLARLRTEKLQTKALQKIAARNQSIKDGGQESYRRIREMLAEEFTLQFNTAIFDPEDAALLPDAGVCSACPKRAGNAPEFADVADHEQAKHKYRPVGGADTCTDPDCWATKKTAHLQREAAKQRAAGIEVVDGTKARNALGVLGEIKGAYVPLSSVKDLLKATGKGADGAKPPQTVMIQNQRDGQWHKAVRTADLVQAGLIKTTDKTAKKAVSHQQQAALRETKRLADMQRAALVTTQRTALLTQVRSVAAGRARDEFDLRLVATAALAGVRWSDKITLSDLWGAKDGEALAKRVSTMSSADLTALLMDCAIVQDVRVEWHKCDGSKPAPLLALAIHYGIDAKTVMQAATSPVAKTIPTPSTAGARAKNAKAAQAKHRKVAYRCTQTGQTWSGRGRQPIWLKVALHDGKSLADFKVEDKTQKVMDKAGAAGQAAHAPGLFDEAAVA